MTNSYDLLDKELGRLHKLLIVGIEASKGHSNHFNQPYGYNNGGVDIESIWNKIVELQGVIVKSYQANDQAMQNKIAEMALLGNSDKDQKV